jgi:hypothetical protein
VRRPVGKLTTKNLVWVMTTRDGKVVFVRRHDASAARNAAAYEGKVSSEVFHSADRSILTHGGTEAALDRVNTFARASHRISTPLWLAAIGCVRLRQQAAYSCEGHDSITSCTA